MNNFSNPLALKLRSLLFYVPLRGLMNASVL